MCCGGERRITVKGTARKGFDVVAALAQLQLGMDTAPEGTVADRWEVCSRCDQFDLGICRKCGCHLSIKARLSNQTCPIGKWREQEDG